MFITSASSHDERDRGADVAVLPVGSFEQHGGQLPLATDALIASAIAGRLATDYDLFLLPPITLGCSHEHADFPGTVSISSRTLAAIIDDVLGSLAGSDVHRLAIINAHGGNYVLSHVAQEANVHARRVVLFPSPKEWTRPASAPAARPPRARTCTPGKARPRSCSTSAPRSSVVLTATPTTAPTNARIY